MNEERSVSASIGYRQPLTLNSCQMGSTADHSINSPRTQMDVIALLQMDMLLT
jgi:hypothetical protein